MRMIELPLTSFGEKTLLTRTVYISGHVHQLLGTRSLIQKKNNMATAKRTGMITDNIYYVAV